MISRERSIKVFTGNSNRKLAEDICRSIGITIGDNDVKGFADGEVSCSINESVRGCDVFLVQSTCKPVNDNLMELLIMIDACRRASAGRITAVIPYFGYARQDRKTKSRDPISAKLVANMIATAGADRIIAMDLHASQIQGFFDIPADNLLSYPVFADYYAKKFGAALHDMVVVSPDVGPIARARKFAQALESNLAIVDRRHPSSDAPEGTPEELHIIGDVEGKDCILFADIVDTANTVVSAAKALSEIGGARRIYACASHGVLSDLAIERLSASNIDELALLDTIPEHPDAARAHLKYLTVAPLFGEAIERIYKEISITQFVF
ncbi:MAG: ribose-phosphate pyrophosphokinase [Oscillospiraceae bacterium]|nr:ribose-phosphate pyrophosphokinase [Oscillospiraceae bacterium]